jgi:hypothetical protein
MTALGPLAELAGYGTWHYAKGQTPCHAVGGVGFLQNLKTDPF